jgi:mono/diheme cytochrome c family protein/cbb3-type cytochrome oxidase subunit 3
MQKLSNLLNSIRFRKLILFTGLLIGGLLLTACEFSLAADVTPPPGLNTAPTTNRSETVNTGPFYPLVAPNPANGAGIYAEKCAPCHGPRGLGDGPQGAQLPNPVPAIGQPEFSRQAKPSDWYAMVTNGNLERYMPPFASLSEGQRWDVIAYVLSMGMSETELEQGSLLYAENCAECHGPQGKGDGPAAASLSAMPARFTDQSWMAQRSGGELFAAVRDGLGGDMPAYGESLSEVEIWNVVGYLRSLSFVGGAQVAAEQATAVSTPGPEPTADPDATEELAGTPEATEIAETTPGLVSGTVRGEVKNGSGGAVPEDLVLTLHSLDHMEVVSTTTTAINSDGTYRFENVEFLPERVFVVTADYGGATYGTDVAIVEPGTTELILPLSIYDTTTEASLLTVDRLHVFFDFSRPDVVQVVELFVISNPTNKTLVAVEEGQGVVEFTLPAGATNVQFQDGELGGRYVPTENGFADTAPVRPGQGQYQVMYAFDMPYDRKVDISQAFTMPVDAMIVMTPAEGVRLRSDFLQDSGVRDVQGEAFQMYTGSSLPAGEPLTFTLSGLPDASGTLDIRGASTSPTGLIIGLGALGLVLVGAGVWLYRRNNRGTYLQDEAELIDADDMIEEVYEDPETIMDAIITLDDMYAAGELPEDAYQQRREALKKSLRELTLND